MSKRADSIELLSVNSIVNMFEGHDLLIYNTKLVNIKYHDAFEA